MLAVASRHPSRAGRALALACMLLLGASSARASATFELPESAQFARDVIRADENPTGADTDPQLLAQQALSGVDSKNVAPRVGESRQPAEARWLGRSLPTPVRELAAGDCEERLASGSGCKGIARWCLARSTSTQAP